MRPPVTRGAADHDVSDFRVALAEAAVQ